MSEAAISERVDGRAGEFAPYPNRTELLEEICQRLGQGEPLEAICREPYMPCSDTVRRWAVEDATVGRDIARARDAGEFAISLEALQIADDKTGDTARDKLRIETRLKLLAKWNPKRWGDGIQLRHADADGEKLDTAPLVQQFLGLMGASPSATVDVIDVTPAPARVGKTESRPAIAPPAPSAGPAQEPPRKPAYRPRGAARPAPRPDDVSDLV